MPHCAKNARYICPRTQHCRAKKCGCIQQAMLMLFMYKNVAATVTTMASPPIDLALGEDGEDHPRRLLLMGNQLVAYGGDHGTLSVLVGDKAQVVHSFDDAIRALAVSHDGKRVAIGFDDGSTKIYRYENAVSPEEQHPFLQKPDSTIEDDFLSQSDGLVGNKDENMFPGPRFDSPVRHLAFDPRSYHLCISSEAGVCIVDVTCPKTLQERYLQDMADREHDASGIRGVCYFHHKGKFMLATLAMDGRLCVWDVTGDDPSIDYELEHRDASKCVPKPDVGEIHNADVCDRSCLPLAVDDSCLVLPGISDVQLRLLHNLEKQEFLTSLPDKGHVDAIVAMAASPDGRHLVTSGRDGRVILWSVRTEGGTRGEFVCQLGQYDSIPTHMLWTETDNKQVLHMACANGTLVNIAGRDKIVPNDGLDRKESSESLDEDMDFETQPPPIIPSTRRKRIGKSNVEKDESNKERGKLETQPAIVPEPGRKRIAKNIVNRDESDDDVDFETETTAPKAPSKQSSSFIADEAEEGIDDEDDDESTSARGKENGNDAADTREDNEDEDLLGEDYDECVESRPLLQVASLPEPQPPFAPSATPLDLPRRIMCWNHLGTVSYLRADDGITRNTVDIDFTDAATRRPMSFTDNMNFILGSIGEDGAIFASDVTDDEDREDDDDVGKLVDGLAMSEKTKALVRRSHNKRMHKNDAKRSTGSNIYFHRFETFGPMRDKDWLLTLTDGERATGCACGEGWAAVITSRRFLRFFSSGGNQGQVVWLKGEPVTVVGRGRFLAAIYHESNPLVDGTQKLGYTLFDALSASAITSGSVSSISAASQLEWAGFSDDFSLIVMDSDGMLSMLGGMTVNDDPAQYSWEWFPMLDTMGLRKSADDKFWPITVQNGKLVCVPLKGGNEHPDASRRPVTSTLGFRMPLARGTIDKSAGLEEISVRANRALTQKKIMNEIFPGEEQGILDDEYDSLCAQVDKVTLKLFMAIATAGKLEMALDLVDRLHLEKSFDIAMTVADRLNHRNLSDRIEEKKELRFMVDDKLDDGLETDYQASFSEPPADDYSDEEEETASCRRITPDANQSRKSKRADAFDDETEKWNRPEKKSRGTTEAKRSLVKPINPFAKKRMESPARQSVSPAKSPSKPSLSRLSTFSAQSREQSKISKRLL